MSNITKSVITFGAVAGIFGLAAFFGLSPFGKQMVSQLVGSSVGSSFNTAKIAEIVMSPIGNTSTSTSILNTDASDRIITDAGVSCTGLTSMNGLTAAGVDAFHWYAATSTLTTSSITSVTLAALNVIVATSSVDGYTATSTYTSPFARRWNTGTYMVFQTNATSSGVTCTPFLHYLGQ